MASTLKSAPDKLQCLSLTVTEVHFVVNSSQDNISVFGTSYGVSRGKETSIVFCVCCDRLLCVL